MPYNNVNDLPQAVRQRFKNKPKRLRQFMHVWNSSYNRHNDESRAFAEAWATVQKGRDAMTDNFNFFLPITKVDKDRRTVSGYASTPTLDLDGEIVSLDAVKKALPGYWEWRNIREMHTSSAVGVAKEANVDGTGLFLTAKIVDDDAWQKCLEQVYKGFSIGGKKLAKTGNTITDIDLVEISVVDRPANPDCRFSVNKRKADLDNASPAHLVKVARTPEEKLLRKIQKGIDLLTKAPIPGQPPAARDGLSLPAPAGAKVKKSKKCAAHGLKGCPMCGNMMKDGDKPGGRSQVISPELNDPFQSKKAKKVRKREFSDEQRDRLASTGAAMPDGSFPIANRGDLDNARQAVGRSKNPGAARAHIRERARALGVTLPDNWSKKLAKRLILLAELEKADQTLSLDYRGPDLDLKKSAKSLTMTTDYNFDLGVDTMDPNSLDQVLSNIMKRGKVVTKAQHLAMAKANIRKARKARQSAMSDIKECHAMHKAAYLSKMAKAAKKPPADDDADDFDHMGAAEKLGKAYQSLDAMKTFMKSASMHLKKAASGRSGQRGEEVGDGKAPWYTVPPGVHDMSPSELATAGPGGDNHGSTPPILDMETVYPGKSAKKSANGKGNTLITQEHANALVRAAAAEAEANLLKSMPANGKRPAAFDVSKFANNGGAEDIATLMNGVEPAGLASDDENIRKTHVGRLIGNMITGGSGRSVFDPGFHGSAGG